MPNTNASIDGAVLMFSRVAMTMPRWSVGSGVSVQNSCVGVSRSQCVSVSVGVAVAVSVGDGVAVGAIVAVGLSVAVGDGVAVNVTGPGVTV